jgi:hypothetical protein
MCSGHSIVGLGLRFHLLALPFFCDRVPRLRFEDVEPRSRFGPLDSDSFGCNPGLDFELTGTKSNLLRAIVGLKDKQKQGHTIFL